MFNKELFLSLCQKYNVELSKKYAHTMIVLNNGIHSITEDDVKIDLLISNNKEQENYPPAPHLDLYV